MQSLHVLRLLLNSAALACALVASSRDSWSVVVPADPPSSSITVNGSDAVRLTFAPKVVCLEFRNGSSDCNEFTSLLTHRDSVKPIASVSTEDLELQRLVAATPGHRLESAVSGWCTNVNDVISTVEPSGMWMIQGVQSMLCLVALETCMYTSYLWIASGAMSVFLSVWTVFRYRMVEGGASLLTIAHTCLGLVLVLEWWVYSVYFMDRALIAMQQLMVSHGSSFYYTVCSIVVGVLACQLSGWISGRMSVYEMAKLYAMPLSPRSRRRRHTPRGESPGTSDDLVEFDEVPIDPLKCPANYNV